MFWLFALATTVGVVLGVPVLFQALDGSPTGHDTDATQRPDPMPFVAFALIAGGLGGLLALPFDPTDGIALVIAVCLGLAGGALHPELLESARKE